MIGRRRRRSTGHCDERHDAFVYAHLRLAFRVVLVAVALEDLAVHLHADADWLLAAGLALFLSGITLVVVGTTRTWCSIWPRLIAFGPHERE